jgi:hypothetical protein
MEFYSTMKKNEILSFASKWMELENIIFISNFMSFLLPLMFSLQQNQRTRGQNKFCPEAEGRR